jgi:dTDP-4-dehydrorhamnose 3,5-epimerase
MDTQTFHINGPVLFKPRRISDERGYFSETFRQSVFDEATGGGIRFLQDNESLSMACGTVRGLHFQSPPHAQGKLVRCAQGALIDVAVDARVGSPTYGQHVRVELSADNGYQLWVPVGFLHGFATLEANTIIQYKCTDYYSKECDGNVLWNDPDLLIDWGIEESTAVLSPKDIDAPRFGDFDSPFKDMI